MRYLLMICTDEKDDFAMTPDAMGQLMAGYQQFTTDLEAAGAAGASERLRPVADATTVKVRDGKVSVSDGPFAETKEQIGGFYLIEAANLDEAIGWAARIPSAAHGSIEVRPVWEPEDYMKGVS